MNDTLETILAILVIFVLAVGAFMLVLVTQPWFWLAVIALILTVALL